MQLQYKLGQSINARQKQTGHCYGQKTNDESLTALPCNLHIAFIGLCCKKDV